jgi:hypothetical protein
MEELNNIPQTQSVEIVTAKLDDAIIKQIQELTQKSNLHINTFGQIYIRKKQIDNELIQLEEILEKNETEYNEVQKELSKIGEDIDETYPQGRINIQEGTVQYQPDAPSRKQLAEQQAQQANQ